MNGKVRAREKDRSFLFKRASGCTVHWVHGRAWGGCWMAIGEERRCLGGGWWCSESSKATGSPSATEIRRGDEHLSPQAHEVDMAC